MSESLNTGVKYCAVAADYLILEIGYTKTAEEIPGHCGSGMPWHGG